MARKTPSTRLTTLAITSGAQTTSVDIPAGSTWAIIAIPYYSSSAGQQPTSVTLNGQAATAIDSAGTTATEDIALFRVPIVGTGAGKTFGWTNGTNVLWVQLAIEYRDGTPTYGAHGADEDTGNPGTALTSSLANSNGDEILSGYVAGNGSTPTFGSGQTALDETDDAVQVKFGITTETATGTGDIQSVTGQFPSIASTVVTVVTDVLMAQALL